MNYFQKSATLSLMTFLMLALLMTSSCAPTTTNTTAATVETSAQVAIASAAGYMALPPCPEKVGSPCGVKETAKKINDAQLALEAAMKTYRASVTAYKLSMTEDNAAAISAAYRASETALRSLNDILRNDTVATALGVK